MVINMNLNISDKTLIITSSKSKRNILLDGSNKGKLLNVKFMSIKEFKNNYFGTYKSDALYFLLKNFNINYAVAKEYLDNIFYDYKPLENIYNDLKDNGYLIINPYFKQTLKDYHIIVINYPNIDDYLVKIFKAYNAEFINQGVNNYLPKVYEFNDIDKEISFVLEDILKNLNNKTLNDFYLVNVDDAYEFSLKRIAKLYNIPLNFNKYTSIYGSKTVQDFLANLKSTYNIEDALNSIKQNNIYNLIVDILNKYTIPEMIDNEFIKVIDGELAVLKIKDREYDNAVNVIGYDEIDREDATYYFMNFNEGIVPKNYYDDALIKDMDRQKLGLNTSIINLNNEKKTITNILRTYPNVIVTYKLKDYFNTYLPSPLISDLNLEVIKDQNITYGYSNNYNKLLLAEKLDNYYKFNELDNVLLDLYATYDNNLYKSYDNSFKGIDYELLKDFLNNKTNLSYSSLDNYYKCSFRFYIANILKLDPFKDTFMTFIGNLFHDCLSHMYDDTFNLKDNYNNFLKGKVLTNKEKFFVDKLYIELEKIIAIIRKQDNHSSFTQVMTEKHIAIDKSHDLTINFLGFVDKIKYEEKDNSMILAIVDYKTGEPNVSLNNINYGLNLQLPIYIYLATNGLHKNVKIAGFYLQKILNSPKLESNNPEMDLQNNLKLDGYTIDDEEIITDLDNTYENSEMILGISKTIGGDFKKNSRLISQEDIDKINVIVNDLIDKAILGIEKCDFIINPKRVNDKLVGCQYCNFKDICFKKEEDIVDLVNKTKKDILGGEEDGNMDE
jgi:ATP-dependent helicase/DNAse subunit B